MHFCRKPVCFAVGSKTSEFASRVAGAVVASLAACGGAAVASDDWVYSVKPGDTLLGVAQDYLARPDDWMRLQRLNHVEDPRHLMPGTRIRVPVALLRHDAAVAEVIDVRGAVVEERPGAASHELKLGDRLAGGATVRTGADAIVSIRFVDGSRLLVTPNSALSLSKLVTLGKSGMAQTVMELEHGSVENKVAHQQLPAAQYELHSRALNLAVRGTEFRARVDDSGGVSGIGEVLEGVVHAQGVQGTPVDVGAGYGTTASPGGAPGKPQRLPEPPDLSGNAQRVEAVPLRFSWPAAPSVRGYHAQVFSDRSFEHLLLDGVFPLQGAVAGAKWADLPDGHYVLRVRAVLANGLEGLNADQDFVLKARPEPPAVIGPLDGAKSYGTDASLRWSRSLNAQTYRVQVSDQPDFARLLVDAKALPDTELKTPLVPGPYYWRVASIVGDDDQGPFGDAQAFTQRAVPESPQLDAPAIDDKQMVFKWKASAPGSHYQVQLARGTDFKDLCEDQSVASNEVRLDRPASGTYYLRIKTVDADGFEGPFGASQRVDVPAPKPWWLLLIPLLALIR